MTAVTVPEDNTPKKKGPSEREKALWKYSKCDDSQLRRALEGICDGKSLRQVCADDPLITAPYQEVCRALMEDEEVIPMYKRARGVQLMGAVDKLVEIAEQEVPYEEFTDLDGKVDKLKANAWLQKQRLSADIYNKILRYGSSTGKDDSDTGNVGGITINITRYDGDRLEAATKTIDTTVIEEE